MLQWRRAASSGALQSGDVYVTRHSNLTEVHVVFHMVIDDSLRSSKFLFLQRLMCGNISDL